jgi:hypothetical protein
MSEIYFPIIECVPIDVVNHQTVFLPDKEDMREHAVWPPAANISRSRDCPVLSLTRVKSCRSTIAVAFLKRMYPYLSSLVNAIGMPEWLKHCRWFEPTATEKTSRARLSDEGGTKRIMVTLNSKYTVPMVVDSGAADVVLSPALAQRMQREGSFTEADYDTRRVFVTAHGSEHTSRAS